MNCSYLDFLVFLLVFVWSFVVLIGLNMPEVWKHGGGFRCDGMCSEDYE